MKELQWRFRDRSKWGAGPWNDEPDKLQWTDPATGLPCLIHRNYWGAWCGYVGLPQAHPDYLKPYEDVEVCVHGGLTFADRCSPDHDPQTGEGICHLPEPGEPDDVWWLGFDCGHAWDLQPGMLEIIGRAGLLEDRERLIRALIGSAIYRDMAFVRSECASLASQLATRAVCTDSKRSEHA